MLLANHFFVIMMPWLYKLLLPTNEDRRVYAVPHSKYQLRREWLSSLITTPIPPLIIIIFISLGLLHINPQNEGFSTILITFFLVCIWSEIWHYYSHYLMHKPRFLWIHKFHHRSRPPLAVSCLSFSASEKAILSMGILAPFLVLSHFVQISFYGIIAYYFLYFFTNTIGHINLEIFPKGFTNTWMGKIFTTSTYHAMHHARYHGNYGLMTSIFDRLHNTIFDDYEIVYARAANGQPLKSQKERFSREYQALLIAEEQSSKNSAG